MSRMAELYEELYGDKPIEIVGLPLEDELVLLASNMSEKEKCKYFGISCSYGICDECEIFKGVNKNK